LVFVQVSEQLGIDKFVKAFRNKENAKNFLQLLTKRGYIEETKIED